MCNNTFSSKLFDSKFSSLSDNSFNKLRIHEDDIDYEIHDDKYHYKVNIAGTEKDDIKIKLVDDLLTVYIKDIEGYKFIIDTDLIDLENISSEYKNGILNIYFYKKEKNEKNIEIK